MNSRIHYLSLASVLSIFAVIIIHVNSLFFWNYAGVSDWWISNLVETFMRFAVPVFFMVSGANLIDYSERYSTKEFFVKRYLKIGIPFLTWSCFAGFFYCVWTGKVVLEMSWEGIQVAVSQYTNTGVYLMYWFLIIISGTYLCIPLLTYIKKEYKEKVIQYLIAIIFLIKYIPPFIYRLCNQPYVSSTLISDKITSYLIFVLVGYILHKKELNLKKHLICYILALAGFAVQAYGTYTFSQSAGQTVEFFGGYNHLPCLLWAIGAFVFIKQIAGYIQSEKVIKGIEWLSGYTFSTYLIHFFLVDYFEAYIRGVNNIVVQIAISVMIFGVSIAFIWLVRKIPGGRKLLP